MRTYAISPVACDVKMTKPLILSAGIMNAAPVPQPHTPLYTVV
jgi:hypothetical protein